ncbi:MAG TPA: phospholipid carrier-dependent glycosyltransferase, partial [Rhizobacter sp.]|nr:phospholipid carrier-dependent glycosyltransferase [Rhizobacter sp.]
AAFGLYLFARRWGSARQAAWAVLLVATQPFFFLAAQFANLDMLVAGCISAAVLLATHAMLLLEQKHPYRLPLVLAYAMAAVGVLAKGLIGAVLPAGVLLGWILSMKRPGLALKLVSVPGLLVFLLIGLPWFAEMQQRYSGFFDYFVVYHHFRRFSQEGFNNQQPVWFYPAVVLLLTLPSSLLLRHALKVRSAAEPAPLSLPALMWCWLGFVIVFFSLPKSKLVGYVLPALPPLAWLLAAGLLHHVKPHRATRWGIVGAGALIALSGVAVLALSHPNSAKPLGLALRQQRHSGEPVVFLDRYPFDLPFYARLEVDPVVTGRWQGQDVARDNWHKELSDASRFAPTVGAERLIPPEALSPLLCHAHTVWLVGTRQEIDALGTTAQSAEIAHTRETSLWKAAAAAGACSR